MPRQPISGSSEAATKDAAKMPSDKDGHRAGDDSAVARGGVFDHERQADRRGAAKCDPKPDRRQSERQFEAASDAAGAGSAECDMSYISHSAACPRVAPRCRFRRAQ